MFCCSLISEATQRFQHILIILGLLQNYFMDYKRLLQNLILFPFPKLSKAFCKLYYLYVLHIVQPSFTTT